MKRTLAIALLYVAPALWPAMAEESKPGTTSTLKPAQTQPLVDAAKDAKAKRKKSSSKVITNADVKKSKGKLIIIDRPETKVDKASGTKELTLEELAERQRARRAAEERVAGAEKKVGELQKEVERVEQRYYEENDPNYRDSVITDRFTQAKRQLDEAQLDLANARDELTAVDNPKP
jgi:hypothetical protein